MNDTKSQQAAKEILSDLGLVYTPSYEKKLFEVGEIIQRHYAQLERDSYNAGLQAAADLLRKSHANVKCCIATIEAATKQL